MVIRFDPQTGLPRIFKAMRYKGTASEARTLWLDQPLEWGTLNGSTVMMQGAATWFEEGTPWPVFNVDDLLCNVTMGGNIPARKVHEV